MARVPAPLSHPSGSHLSVKGFPPIINKNTHVYHYMHMLLFLAYKAPELLQEPKERESPIINPLTRKFKIHVDNISYFMLTTDCAFHSILNQATADTSCPASTRILSDYYLLLKLELCNSYETHRIPSYIFPRTYIFHSL